MSSTWNRKQSTHVVQLLSFTLSLTPKRDIPTSWFPALSWINSANSLLIRTQKVGLKFSRTAKKSSTSTNKQSMREFQMFNLSATLISLPSFQKMAGFTSSMASKNVQLTTAPALRRNSWRKVQPRFESSWTVTQTTSTSQWSCLAQPQAYDDSDIIMNTVW